MDTRIESIHFTADSKLKELIQQKLDKLPQYYDRIINATVLLKLESSSKVKDKVVELKVDIPGDVLFAKDTQKTFEAATDNCCSAIERQLKKHKEKLRSY